MSTKPVISNRLPLFYAFTVVFWGSIYAYMSFLTPFSTKVGASAVVTGLIVGGYGFVQMVLRVPVGVLSDRTRRRKPFVIVGILASLLAAVGMLLFPTPLGLLVFRSLTGIAAAAWVTITVLFSSYFAPEDAPKAIGQLNIFNTLGVMSASLVGAQLAQAHGEWSAFVLAIALAAVGLVMSFFLKEKRPVSAKPIAVTELLKIGLTPTLLVVSIIAVVAQTVSLGTSGSFTQAWAKQIGATTGQLGWLSIATNVPGMAASMLGSTLLIKRFKPRVLIMCGGSLVAISVFLLPFTTNFYALLPLQMMQGFGHGLSFVMLMSLAILSIPNEKRGVAMGFFQSIYALGMFVGPVLSGALQQTFALRSSFFFMSGISLLVILIAAVFLRPERQI